MSDPIADLEALLPKLMRQLFPMPDILAEFSLGQIRLLRLLEDGEPRRIGELADKLGLTPSAVSQHCHKLRAQGLLLRQEVEGDARGRTVMLTNAGHDLFNKVRERRIAQAQVTLAHVPAEEIDKVLEILRKFQAQIHTKNISTKQQSL